MLIERPMPNEYNAYYTNYIQQVPDGDFIKICHEQLSETTNLLSNVTNKDGEYRYATGKWSIKEVLGHMTDTERIMTYRLLCIARGETAALPGFNENTYVEAASFDSIHIQDLLNQYILVRKNTIELIKSLPASTWTKTGIANNDTTSVRALAYITVGHEIHHRRILTERYFTAL
ncbi:MAG: DinB family protein [Bacillus sp. (in: firmicutes)]